MAERYRISFVRRGDTYSNVTSVDSYEFTQHGLLMRQGPMYDVQVIDFVPYANLVGVTIEKEKANEA